MKAIIRAIDPTTSAPRYTEMDDPWMDEAVTRIFSDFGDEVYLKAKPLNKFGQTANADSGVKTLVATLQGTEVLETYATGNTIDYVVSDSGSDTYDVVVEGHYYDATVDDGSPGLVYVMQTVTLTGQTPAALSTPLMRCTRMYIDRNGATLASPIHEQVSVGNIYAYDSAVATGVTLGVPDVASATKCILSAGQAQSQKCATSTSYRDYWIITHLELDALKGNSGTASADGELEVSTNGEPFRPYGAKFTARAGGNQTHDDNPIPYIVVPPNSDVRLTATTNIADGEVSAHISGVLAVVRGTE